LSDHAIADLPSLKRQGLFPCETEIARRLSQSERRWRAVARVLEPEGLPKIDQVMGGRYWPAVVAFFDKRYSIIDVRDRPGNNPPVLSAASGGEDGEERWDAA
jgi:hypothetical protein